MTSSFTSFRPYSDQENSQTQVLNSKLKGNGSLQGPSFAPAKSFKSLNTAPQATPRRALGDIGNTAFKPTQSNKLPRKTPGGKKFVHGTPRSNIRMPLAQQIAGAGIKSSEPVFPEKEKMFPCNEKEEDLPQPESVKRILKNIKRIYRSCPSKQAQLIIPEDPIISFSDPGLCTEVPPVELESDLLNVPDISNMGEISELEMPPLPELIPIDDSFFRLGDQ